MANTSRINGFRPVRYLGGAPWNGQANLYVHSADDATALHVGDLVIQGANSTKGYQAVTRATSGTAGALIGVVTGIEPPIGNHSTALAGTALDLGEVYIAASAERFVWVADDPKIIFEAEFDAAGDMPDHTDVGLNYDFLTTAGNTTTGASGMTIDSSSEVTTAATPLKLVGLVRRPDNDITDADDPLYQRGLVIINMHIFNGNDEGAVGV